MLILSVRSWYLPTSNNVHVWWFGGRAESSTTEHEESCKLVAVRIERTSPNSRRIAGDIIVNKPLEDAWAILTDYDNLAIHVPNLVESKRVNSAAGIRANGGLGEQGDRTYQCRLFQRGAQKIVGFEFGASVTMDIQTTFVERNAEYSSNVSNVSNHPSSRNLMENVRFPGQQTLMIQLFAYQNPNILWV